VGGVGLTGWRWRPSGWSANLFTVVSDLFPKAAVASVVGIGGMVALSAVPCSEVHRLYGGVDPQLYSGVRRLWIVHFVALIIVHLMTPATRQPGWIDPARLSLPLL